MTSPFSRLNKLPKKDSRSLWQRLVEPRQSVTEADVRRRVQLLSSLLLIEMPFLATGAAFTWSASMGLSLTLAGAVAVLLVAYGLSRTRYYRPATVITMGVQALLPFVGLIYSRDYSALSMYTSLSWIVLSVLIGSLFLGRRGLLALVVASIAGTVLVPIFIGAMSPSVISLLGYVVTASAAILVTTHYRNQLEADRLAELSERNREIQLAQTALEQRVAEVDQRTAQLKASAEVSRVVTSVLDPDDLIRQVVELITDRFDFYYAAVFLLDDFGKYAVLREATGTAGRLLKESEHQLEIGGQSMVSSAIINRKPRVAGQVADEPIRFVNPLLPDTRSEAALPLIVGDRVLGALDVQSLEADVFDDGTLAMLQSLADQIAIALNTARQFRNAQLDARQATALFEASQLAGFISESLESATEHLLSTVAKHSDFDIWLAASYDADNARYTLIAAHRAAHASGEDGVRVDPSTDAPTALAIRLRQPVIINDPDIDPLLTNLSSDERQAYGRSVSVPALLGERVVGAVSLGRAIDKSPIDQRDVQLAQAVASQVAVTIENRRLFDQAQQAVAELDALMRRYTQEGWQKFRRSRPGVVQQEFADPGALPVYAEMMPQVEQAARLAGTLPVTFDEQAALAIPIALRGQVIGTLGVQAEADRQWTDDELATLKAVADQVAQSVEIARLLDATEASLQETTALYQASRAMASATTPVEVMHLVVNTLHARLDVAQVDLVLYDEDLGYGTIAAQAVPDSSAGDTRFLAAGDPCYEAMLAERRPLGISDLAAHPATAHLSSDLYQRGVQAVLLAPLMVGQRLIGFIRADAAGSARQFMDNELEFCETLTRQAAVAIENRRLFEETQRRAEIESALNQISQTIKASLDPQAVLDLQSAITEMGRVLQSSRSYYLANDDDVRFVYAYEWCAQNVPALRGTRQSWMALPEMFGRLKDGQSLVSYSVQRDDAPELRRWLGEQGVRSHIHVPVLTGNRLIGVLGFDQIDRERRWMAEEVNMVQRIADQLAAALENARLYQNVRSRVNELTALTRIGRRLAATLDLEDVLNTIVEEALNVTPADRGSIALHDSRQDVLELRVLIGYPEKTRQHILEDGYDILRREDGLHGRLLATGQAVLSNDVHKDAGYAAVDSDTRSELIVPIRQGETLLGALNLESPHTYAFSDSDQRLIEALADQAAVAIANARAYESERAALERMREVDRLKTQFLANMSHELRTPLNSIIGFSRVILRGIDGPLTDLQQADLTAIHNSGQHLLGLINDILDLSKIEAGKMELSLEDLDLADVIKGVMSTAIALVKDKKVELHQEVPTDLPPIRADARRIRQVVLNLVSNAAKFTEAGRITARVVIRSNEVQISVNDTGIGIPEDKLAHIFEEFTQVDASTTRKVGGTGLGLAISRRFVEMHGGRMWVESEVGTGSTFTFTLPLKQPGEAEEGSLSDELVEPDPDRRRILCIDDDPGVITLYQRYLEKQGFQVIGLQDSSRALEEARRLQPVAITLDVLMPNRDGWMVLAELKTAPETSGIPIIVCSIVEDESKGFSLGAADYLVKPISERDLMRALDRVNGQRPVKTVLVIDDEADALRLVRRMLELRPGVQVQEAQGGAMGIASVQVHRPDVVLLDLMMPDIDGFAVLETIKNNRHSRDIPVIIVTAKELTEEDRARLQGKAAALLNKGTLDPQTLLSEITSALNRIDARRPSPDLNDTQPLPQAESVAGQ